MAPEEIGSPLPRSDTIAPTGDARPQDAPKSAPVCLLRHADNRGQTGGEGEAVSLVAVISCIALVRGPPSPTLLILPSRWLKVSWESSSPARFFFSPLDRNNPLHTNM